MTEPGMRAVENRIFGQLPQLEGQRVLLREMVPADAPALGALASDDEIYRLEPTFLYERKYADPAEVIARLRAECLDTRESLLWAVCLRSQPDQLVGIGEAYGLEPQKPKMSIGYRLRRPWWGQGIATEVAGLLRDYLRDECGMRTITAHVLPDNLGSARVLEKNGFRRLFSNIPEDWGWDELVPVDKWVYKRRWDEGFPED